MTKKIVKLNRFKTLKKNVQRDVSPKSHIDSDTNPLSHKQVRSSISTLRRLRSGYLRWKLFTPSQVEICSCIMYSSPPCSGHWYSAICSTVNSLLQYTTCYGKYPIEKVVITAASMSILQLLDFTNQHSAPPTVQQYSSPQQCRVIL